MIYKLKENAFPSFFQFNTSPHSWKNILFPAKHVEWSARKTESGFEFRETDEPEKKFAFLGVRACDLHAINIQDKVFMQGKAVDRHYQSLRDSALVIVVQCTRSGNTCFCASMNTGPKARDAYDLALTEVVENGDHFFLLELGSARGQEIASRLNLRIAEQNEIAHAEKYVSEAAVQQKRRVNTAGIKELLYSKFDDAHWQDIANRCLSCGNCTLVCPTCFCSSSEDVTDLLNNETKRVRSWDSCFQKDHSYIHGGAVRTSTKSRYRQWMTHKLASWIDQFGEPGCVGCGRCITWCPVGIDITEEAAAFEKEKT